VRRKLSKDAAVVRRLPRITVLIAFAVAPTVALAASSTSSQVWVTNCSKAQYKPILITVACGDGYTYVNKLKWSTWTTTTATGKGDYAYNTCTPSCVSGHIKSDPVTATLSEPKSCPGQKHKVFKNFELMFSRGRPSYVHKAAYQVTLTCPFVARRPHLVR
jgi:hypothetical protein